MASLVFSSQAAVRRLSQGVFGFGTLLAHSSVTRNSPSSPRRHTRTK